MPSVTAPPPSTLAPQAPAAPAAAVATVTNPPPQLQNLPQGSVLQGQVAGSDGQGHTVIQTDQGPISLAGTLPLAKGAAVTLEVQTLGPQTQVLVMGTGGRATAEQIRTAITPDPSQLVGNGADVAEPAPPLDTLPPQGGGAPLAVGARLIALVVKLPDGVVAAATAGAEGTQSLPSAAGATSAEAATAAGDTPASPAAASPAGASPAGASLGPASPGDPIAGSPASGNLTGANAGTAASPTGAPGPELGARLLVRILAVIPPGAEDPAMPPPSLPAGAGAGSALLSAAVLGTDSQGRLAIQSPLGVLTLPAGQDLPSGTGLALALMGRADAPAAAVPLALEPMAAGPGQGWPALDQALAHLGQQAPEAAARLIAALPTPGPHLAADLAAFVGAITNRDLKRLLGNGTLEALKAGGRGDLAARLEGDVETMAGSRSAAPGQWQAMTVPMQIGGRVEEVQLFLRKGAPPPEEEEVDGRPGQGRKSAPGTRFLLNLVLSQMGPLQLDGFSRTGRLDLVLRSARALPPVWRQDISQIFNASCGAMGVAGQMQFQTTPRFVKPERTPPPPPRLGLFV